MWSGDCTTTPEEVIEAAEASGLDVLCITDHHAIAGAQRLTDALAEVGVRVVVGEEVKSTSGELIGLFLSERIPFGLRPGETAAAIRAQGGIVYIPHPFDPMRRALTPGALDALVAEGLVDALEAFNAKISLRHLNERAGQYAAAHGLPAGAGSDAHVPAALGAAYVEMADFDGPSEFLEALAGAVAVGHHWDRARPWTARIVPSLEAG
jgi:predicted metal-dependent phosphoesterase TrpH